jgi:hypothetical protein
MKQGTTYVAFDTSKETIAVAIAESGNHGEVRFFGTIASRPEAVGKVIEKLAQRHERLVFRTTSRPLALSSARLPARTNSEGGISIIIFLVPVPSGKNSTSAAVGFPDDRLSALQRGYGQCPSLLGRLAEPPGGNQKRGSLATSPLATLITRHLFSS